MKPGRCFETRKKEHIRNVKTCANVSNIAKHAWSFGHRGIDFNHSRVIDKGSFRIRKTLEAWHTSVTKHADNNSNPIPTKYSILFKQYPPCHYYYFLITFILPFCVYISPIYISCFIRGGLCRRTVQSLCFFFKTFSQRTLNVFVVFEKKCVQQV